MTDNEQKERRIALRIDQETWEDWDNKRHAQRTSFQQLGVKFFTEWASTGSHSEPLSGTQPTGKVTPDTIPSIEGLTVAQSAVLREAAQLMRTTDAFEGYLRTQIESFRAISGELKAAAAKKDKQKGLNGHQKRTGTGS